MKISFGTFGAKLTGALVIMVCLWSCNDYGTGLPEAPVAASPMSVSVAPGASVTVVITGGRIPYYISQAPLATTASATFQDPNVTPANLVISAPDSASNGAMTTVTVGDQDELGGGGALPKIAHEENEVTIQIMVSSTISLAGNVQPIFSANCAVTGCHAGSTPQSGLSLTNGMSYLETVNVNATGTTCAGAPRVDPGSSTTSVLYRLVSGTCGPRMPFSAFGPGDTLSAAQQDTIRDWIDQGALNN